jgi:hypothetical protein
MLPRLLLPLLLGAAHASGPASAPPATWSTAGGSPQRTQAAPAGTAPRATDGSVAWRWASGNYTRHVASAVTPVGSLLVVSRTRWQKCVSPVRPQTRPAAPALSWHRGVGAVVVSRFIGVARWA